MCSDESFCIYLNVIIHILTGFRFADKTKEIISSFKRTGKNRKELLGYSKMTPSRKQGFRGCCAGTSFPQGPLNLKGYLNSIPLEKLITEPYFRCTNDPLELSFEAYSHTS